MKLTRFLPTATAFVICTASCLVVVGCNNPLNKKDDDAPTPSAAFTFLTDLPAAYDRVDRVGMPAVATALITSKDSYNTASPSDDASGLFVNQISSNLDSIHIKLNDDVTAAGLTPTNTAGSLANAAAAIVPDTLKIDTTAPAGFPNGRQLTDRVVDMTLSLVLLNQGGGQDINTLANLPLNPPANDKVFGTTFPYLAAPF